MKFGASLPGFFFNYFFFLSLYNLLTNFDLKSHLLHLLSFEKNNYIPERKLLSKFPGFIFKSKETC